MDNNQSLSTYNLGEHLCLHCHAPLHCYLSHFMPLSIPADRDRLVYFIKHKTIESKLVHKITKLHEPFASQIKYCGTVAPICYAHFYDKLCTCEYDSVPYQKSLNVGNYWAFLGHPLDIL